MTPHWLRALLIALGLFVLLLAFFSPPLVAWKAIYFPEPFLIPETHRGYLVLRQLQDPLIGLRACEMDSTAWRLLLPVIGYLLHLSDEFFLAIPFLGTLVTLFVLVLLFYARTGSYLYASIFTAAFGSTSWFFVSSHWLGYHDSVLVLCMLGAVFCRDTRYFFTICLLGPWLGERFLLTMPLFFVLRYINVHSHSSEAFRLAFKDGLRIVLAASPYLVSRAYLYISGIDCTVGAHLSLQSEKSFLSFVVLVGAWHGFRAVWLFLLGLPPIVKGQKPYVAYALFVVIAYALAANILLTLDLSRSMFTLMPLLVFAALRLIDEKPRFAKKVAVVCLVLNFVLPASHINIDFDRPIYSILAEVRALQYPPKVFSQDAYIAEAAGFLDKKNFAEARRMLEIAHTLGSTNADIELMESYLFWTEKNLVRALSHVDRALELGDATWERRPQAEQYRRQLKKQMDSRVSQ